MESINITEDVNETNFVEGFKTVADYVQSGFLLLTSATRWSNNLPSTHIGYSYNNPSSGYTSASNGLKHNLKQVLDKLISKQNFHRNKSDKNFEQLPELNDVLVDSINDDLAELDGVPKEKEPPLIVHKTNIASRSHIPSWNSSPTIQSLQLGKTKMLAATNVERPQISFKDKVDNSTKTLWEPKLTEKPNSLKPLALTIEYDAENQPVGFCHPYEVEIDAFSPQAVWLSKKDIDCLPIKDIASTKLTMVETKSKLMELVDHLKTVKEVAVDVEHHSYRTYLGITCLLQISTEEGGDFIIDTLSLREHLQILNECFTNPKIIKIFHGASLDIIWLQRDLGIYVVGLFDTFTASTLLGLNRRSLKALLFHYFSISLDKTYQLADWRIRPLPSELCEYARRDTHYLIPLWRVMKKDLLEKSTGKINLVEQTFSQSKLTCLQTFVKPVLGENDHMNLYLKSRKIFNSRQMKAFKSIYQWRDDIARIEDESINYVLPNHMLLQIAETLPREVQGLLACCNPVPPLLRRHLISVHQMVLRAREAKLERNLPNNSVAPAPPINSTLPSVLLCVHDKIYDDDEDRESLPKTGKGGPIRRQKKKHSRKPWTLETPPPINDNVDLSDITKKFISPYERFIRVNEYKEYIQSHEETTTK